MGAALAGLAVTAGGLELDLELDLELELELESELDLFNPFIRPNFISIRLGLLGSRGGWIILRMRTEVGVLCELCELCELREDVLVGVLGDLVTLGELLFDDDWLDLAERLEEDGDANCPLPADFAFVVGLSGCLAAFGAPVLEVPVLETPVFGALVFGVLVLQAVVFELLVFESFVFESTVFTSFVFESLVLRSFVFGLFFLLEPVSGSSSFASTAFRLATLGLSTFASSGRTGDSSVLSPPCCPAKRFSNSSQEPKRAAFYSIRGGVLVEVKGLALLLASLLAIAYQPKIILKAEDTHDLRRSPSLRKFSIILSISFRPPLLSTIFPAMLIDTFSRALATSRRLTSRCRIKRQTNTPQSLPFSC